VFAIPGSTTGTTAQRLMTSLRARRTGACASATGRRASTQLVCTAAADWWIWASSQRPATRASPAASAVAEQMGPGTASSCAAEPSWYALGTPGALRARTSTPSSRLDPARRQAVRHLLGRLALAATTKARRSAT
jgi:hypothetical protein